MTQLYLAMGSASAIERAFQYWDWDREPVNMLVAYPYLPSYFRRMRKHRWLPKRTMLDSGAFSAWRSGYEIDIDDLLKIATVPGWTKCVALDVVGDPEASTKNARYMREKGCDPMPVFHIGEPMEALADYCAEFEYVGLSCRFGESVSDSLRWLDACFAQSYPHHFHSFGWVKESMLLTYPFYSADTASWCNAPGAFGRWRRFGYQKVSIPDNRSCLKTEIRCYLELEEKVIHRWKAELEKLERENPLAHGSPTT